MNYFVQFLKSKKKNLFFIVSASLIEVFATLFVPYFVARIIDKGISQGNVQAIVLIGLQMLGAAALAGFITLVGSYLCADLAALAAKYLRQKVFEKTQLLSVKDFNQFSTASMITRATGDITVIQQTIIMFTQMVLPTPLILIAAVVMTAVISPALVAVPLVSMLVFSVLIWLLFKKSSPISETIQMHVDKINRIVRESIVGIRVIRAFGNTEYEQKRSDDAFTEYANNVIHLNRIFAAFNPFVWGIMGIAMAAVVWFGGHLVVHQQILVGSIAAVSEYTILMLTYLMMAAMSLVMLPRMVACLHRIQEVLDMVPEIQDEEVPSGSFNPNQPEKIVFENVTFSYKGAEKPVLENLNFTCERGKVTAIIGGTGSGKSTLAALMLRLHDVQSGRVLLEGKDVRHMTQHQLRERISYVPQKAFLFSGTIAENLRMGHKDASEEELHHAAQIAQAESFIASLEKGYESPVAQGGTNFSGGQKQRLCIARALIKKAPVYLFDDSFSALDFKTDAALRNALRKEVKDAAVVIIAQRISTIMEADQILVLDAGKMIAIGKHEELMQTCAIYKEIAQSQLTQKEVNGLE